MIIIKLNKLNTFFAFFTQEYAFLVKNFSFNFKKSLLLGVFFIIYLFLIISGETIPFPLVILIYSCFGFIVFASFLFSFYYLPKYFFPKLYKSLSLIKYIFWFAITMLFGTVLSYFFHCFVYKNSIDYFGFILYVKYISVLLFPILFLAILLDYISTLKNKLYDIESINNQISSNFSISKTENKTYKFISENKKENLELIPKDILFICAADNYIEVFYLNNNNELEKKLIRSKIKTIENDLHNHFLVKTHRSYLCNLKNVSRVSKTQNNYFLHFDRYNIKIPVSSQNTEHVFDELNKKN